mmetsp:Transcript_113540/g.260568  ORF Transcript_113540/g.260568 Transcript_113540/m.260568 type:complete len:244 (-) Transcript_113540:1799-2530(-)
MLPKFFHTIRRVQKSHALSFIAVRTHFTHFSLQKGLLQKIVQRGKQQHRVFGCLRYLAAQHPERFREEFAEYFLVRRNERSNNIRVAKLLLAPEINSVEDFVGHLLANAFFLHDFHEVGLADQSAAALVCCLEQRVHVYTVGWDEYGDSHQGQLGDRPIGRKIPQLGNLVMLKVSCRQDLHPGVRQAVFRRRTLFRVHTQHAASQVLSMVQKMPLRLLLLLSADEPAARTHGMHFPHISRRSP